jgi:hypothetical protein
LKHRLFNVFAYGLLALFVVTAALWVRSYWRSDAFYNQGDWELDSGRGQLAVISSSMRENSNDWEVNPQAENPLRWFGKEEFTWKFAGFAYGNFCEGSLPVYYVVVSVPHWFCCLGAATGVFLFRQSCIPLEESSLCRVCGYDLRATPDRCPECGTAPNKVT